MPNEKPCNGEYAKIRLAVMGWERLYGHARYNTEPLNEWAPPVDASSDMPARLRVLWRWQLRTISLTCRAAMTVRSHILRGMFERRRRRGVIGALGIAESLQVDNACDAEHRRHVAVEAQALHDQPHDMPPNQDISQLTNAVPLQLTLSLGVKGRCQLCVKAV